MEGKGVPIPRIPASTYRLQFSASFRFTDAADVVHYLHELGITDVYASPYFKSRKGSPHGYDIVDPTMLNPEVGTEEEYRAFTVELQKRGMGQLLDIVPNHMCNESANLWWSDVLENGRSSVYADFFDIDWEPAVRKLSGKLLIPILGDQYGKVLESQGLKLLFDQGAFFISCYDQKFPVMPETYLPILEHRINELRELLCEDNPRLREFLSVLTALKHLPPVTEKDTESISERYREKEIGKKRLAALYRESAEIGNFVDENVRIFNGARGDPKSFNLLDSLLAMQVWRLSHWRVATEEINYRRFFDINNIIAVRMEDPRVFRETHSLIFRLVGEGAVTGLRVDHTDGLYDPAGYFSRLQAGCFGRLYSATSDIDSKDGPADISQEASLRYNNLLSADPQYRPFYVVAEKILTKGEKMPDWPVSGTTGYSFLNSLNCIFVDTGHAKLFDALYSKFIGRRDIFQDVLYEKKKLVMQVAMSGEVNTLGHHLNIISERHRHTRDFTLNSLTKAITEVIAYLPVYRSYTGSWTLADRDRQYISAAVSRAKKNNPALSSSIFDFLGDVLTLNFIEEFSEDDKKDWLDFAMEFQQVTAPVMGKGLEDTAFYVYNRLISLNEVGGSPDRFGQSLEAFHGQNLDRLKFWPHALIATSTHDTKRSEDVRARINVLSEVPEKWRERLIRWGLINKKKKVILEGVAVPDRNEEYLLYQTLIGSWPQGGPEDNEFDSYKIRIKEYMVKALREAKVNTSWINPHTDYENAATSFVEAVLANTPGNKFLREFVSFQKTVSHFGMLNSLSQTVLKMASPGVPDFYQGTEIWDYSLVDPDNRRPVDFKRRMEMLSSLKKDIENYGANSAAFQDTLLEKWQDGFIKLYVTWKALTFRRDHHLLFREGSYIPLAAEGELKDHVCGFARQDGDETIVVVVPRLTAKVMQFNPGMPLGEKVWEDAGILLPDEIPGATFQNVLTGEIVEASRGPQKRLLSVAHIFSRFPVAMLLKKG